MSLIEFPKHGEEDAQKYSQYRWWLGMTLGDVLNKTADVFPEKEAIVDDRVRLTYSELREESGSIRCWVNEIRNREGRCCSVTTSELE